LTAKVVKRLGEELRVHDDTAVLQIGDAVLERDQRPLAIRKLDLEQVARAVILHRCDLPDGTAFAIGRREADQVGVIIFTFIERRQRGAIDLHQRAAQRFGCRAIGDAFESRHGGLAAIPNGEEAPLGASDVQLFMAGEAPGAVGEQLQANLAFDAMRAGDRGERDLTPAKFVLAQAFVSSGAPSAGSSADSPLSAFASAGSGEPSVGGVTSSAPSAGASADSP
jgi:hypothetical protein